MAFGATNASQLNSNLVVTEGAWFVPLDGSINAFPTGPDNRILIAQLTVPTGSLKYSLNVSIFNDGIGADPLYYAHGLQDEPGMSGDNMELNGWCQGLVYDPLDLDNCPCGIPGCTDPTACNYDSFTPCDNGSCTYPGCTDPDACNWDPNSGCDDGSCDYPEEEGDFNCSANINIEDLMLFLSAFGCSGECGAPDLNEDQIVSILDLLEFVSSWSN